MKKRKKEPESYDYGQYWKVNYKEKRPNGQIFNFKTILYCRSKSFALTILKKKTNEDNPGSIVSSANIVKLGSHSRIKNKKLSVDDWFHIRNAAFPNEVNVLFKK